MFYDSKSSIIFTLSLVISILTSFFFSKGNAFSVVRSIKRNGMGDVDSFSNPVSTCSPVECLRVIGSAGCKPGDCCICKCSRSFPNYIVHRGTCVQNEYVDPACDMTTVPSDPLMAVKDFSRTGVVSFDVMIDHPHLCPGIELKRWYYQLDTALWNEGPSSFFRLIHDGRSTNKWDLKWDKGLERKYHGLILSFDFHCVGQQSRLGCLLVKSKGNYSLAGSSSNPPSIVGPSHVTMVTERKDKPTGGSPGTTIANEENTETNSPLPTGENSKANNKKIWIAVSLGLSGVVPIAIVVLVLRCRRNCKKETTESRRHPPEQPFESAVYPPSNDYEYVHYPCLVNGLRTPMTATRTPLNERTLTRSAETSELRLPDQRLLTQTSSPTPGGTTRIRPYPSDQLDRCARVEDVDPQTEDFEYDYARVEIDPVKMRNIFRILGSNDAVDSIPNACMEITIGDLSNTAYTPKPIVRKLSPSRSCRSDCDSCTYEIVAERKSGCCLHGNECLKPQNLRPPASYESLSGSRPEEYEEMRRRRSVMRVEDHESAEIEEDNGHEYYVFKAVAERDEASHENVSGSRPEEYEEMGKRRSLMMMEDHEPAETEEDNGHEYYVFKAVAE